MALFGGGILRQELIATVEPSLSNNSNLAQANGQFNLDFKSPELYIVAFLGIVLIWLNFFNQATSNKLASSYWAGATEIKNNRIKGQQLIAKPTRNQVCLYINPDKISQEKTNQELAQLKIPPLPSHDKPTYYITDAARGTAVIGAAGTGKSYGVIDPMMQSSIDQGFPVVLYDVKYPTQSKRIAAYAAKRGYKVRVFAPGFIESDSCNLLDLIEDESDKIGAGQLGKTLIKNASKMDQGKGDPFFEDAGESFAQGVFLIVKAIPKMLAKQFPPQYANPDGTPNAKALSYCDLISCQALMALPNLAERLAIAKENATIDAFAGVAISQVLQVKDSEKTVSGILGTTQKLFMKFIEKKFINAFTGQTTIPLNLDEKELLIIGMDRNNRDIVAPLLASVLDMIVSRNVMRPVPRKKPLVCFLDEVVTLYLPRLQYWLAENREDGFVGVLGYQNQGQLQQMYGKEAANIIFGNCANKFIFNPQEIESAKLLADMLGEEEINYRTSSSSSGKGGGSTSSNQNRSKKQLIEAAQIMKLGQSKCVILNPDFANKKESYIPYKTAIKVSKTVLVEKEWSESKWDDFIGFYKDQFTRYSLPTSDNIREAISEREKIVAMLFPMPQKQQQAA